MQQIDLLRKQGYHFFIIHRNVVIAAFKLHSDGWTMYQQYKRIWKDEVQFI